MVKFFSTIKVLFFPDICICCSRKLVESEKNLCINCIIDMPLTNEWGNHENNTFVKICDRVPIENACALLDYKKESDYSFMIHNMKFRNERKALRYVGNIMGRKFYEQTTWIKDIDIIIPVPLHFLRELKRGYNQSEELAKGVNQTLKVTIDTTSVKRIKYRHAQVKVSGAEKRWHNVKSIFKVVDSKLLEGKHLLIIDDVITTGATVTSLIEAIKADVPDVRISVISLSTAIKTTTRKLVH